MTKQNKKDKKNILNLDKKLIIIIILIFVIIISIWSYNTMLKIGKNVNPTEAVAKDYNVMVDIPQNNLGDLSQVPQEKIDSLFSNLKQ